MKSHENESYIALAASLEALRTKLELDIFLSKVPPGKCLKK